MANLPSARTVVQDTAGAIAAGTDLICVLSPCAISADMQPRQFGNAAAIYAQHGFSDGLEYAALHFDETAKPVLFVGLPISTPGAVGRVDTSGNTGSSAITVTAGGTGVLGEHSGVVTVVKGGTIGTDQIQLSLSLDGGRNAIPIRLGVASSFVPAYVNVTVAFGAGTLVAGDTVLRWKGTAPLSAAADWITARQNLASQQKFFRSILLIGDLQGSSDASNFLTQLNAYETANERFVYGRCSVADRSPLAQLSNVSHGMTGAPTLTFADLGSGSGDNVTRSAGSWITDGFVVGDQITITGTASNNGTYNIVAVSATVISVGIGVYFVTEVTAAGTVIGHPGLVFAASGHTVTRNTGSWLADGFAIGDVPTFAGTVSNNALALAITALTATVMTFASGVTNETIGANVATVTKGQTLAAWMAAQDALYASIDNAPHIDIAAGRGRVLSPFTAWAHRRSAAWAASLREYSHDLQITTWRKSDGPTGFDLFDTSQNLVEWDDRVQGGAGSAARFTTFRTWANGPNGAFIALSLTRAVPGSLLSYTHNAAVVNLASNVNQAATEVAAVGVSLVLNDNGTATTDSLSTIQKYVNDQLELALLSNATGEGQRVSSAIWTPSADDVLNVPDATLNGVLALNLLGTIVHVNTTVRVRTGG